MNETLSRHGMRDRPQHTVAMEEKRDSRELVSQMLEQELHSARKITRMIWLKEVSDQE